MVPLNIFILVQHVFYKLILQRKNTHGFESLF